MSEWIEYNLNDAIAGFDITKNEISSSVRHGVALAINNIRDKAKANFASSGVSTAPMKDSGVSLLEGIKAYMLQKEEAGVVSILGTIPANDGTWRLRFFETGTKERFIRIKGSKKKGHTLGRIKSNHFFSNTIAQTQSIALRYINESIQNKINELSR